MRLFIAALCLAISYAQTECLMRERKPAMRLNGEILVVEGQTFTVVTDIVSCEALCVHHHAPECNGFTFSVQTKRCFLKTAVTAFTASVVDDISSFCQRSRDFYKKTSSSNPSLPAAEQPTFFGGVMPSNAGDGPGPSISYVDTMNFGPAPYGPLVPDMGAPLMPPPGIASGGTPRMMNCEPLLSAVQCNPQRGCFWKGFECDNVNCESQITNPTECAKTPGCSWTPQELKCNDYEEGIAYKQGGMGGFMSGMGRGFLLNAMSKEYAKMREESEVEVEFADFGGMERLKKSRNLQGHKSHPEFYNEDGTFRLQDWIELKQSICPNLESVTCRVEKACEWKNEQCVPVPLLLTSQKVVEGNHFFHHALAFFVGLLLALVLYCVIQSYLSKKGESLSGNAW